jgi:hypothetical protein
VVGAVGVGSVAARAQEAEQVVGKQAGEEGPDEEAKGDGGRGGAAANGDGHGDGAGEPEDDSEAFEDQGDEAVEGAGKEARGQSDVNEDEDGPDGVEEHESPRGGCAVAPDMAIPEVDAWGMC